MKQNMLIPKFLSELSEERRNMFTDLMEHFIKLGYMPRELAFKTLTLSFKNGRQVIAKAHAYNSGEFRIKFFACENPSE